MSQIVSFILPALNEELHIGDCLRSIKRLELPAGVERVEMIVVDNQSTDRTEEISVSEGAIVVRVPAGNPSLARNTGASRANGEWLAFVDADCELPTNWLVVCCSHLSESGRVIGVAGVMEKPGGDATWVERAWFELAHGKRCEVAATARWLPTFNLLLRRDAFESVGCFDESLTTCEDCDLGYRLSASGFLIIDPRAKVIHNGESRSLRELFRREAWRTRGNVRLAWGRPFDGSNWLSLLFPPAVVILMLGAFAGGAGALWRGATAWPWLVALFALIAGVAAIVLRKSMTVNIAKLVQQIVVFLAYLSGRTAGLFWAFQRVER